MAARIVLFGATGHTGSLVARRLAAAGASPLLLARDHARTAALARELGGLDHAVADARDPASVAARLDRGTVLVSTVGPFTAWGGAALEAAIARGATYLDCTGEPSFIAAVFSRDRDARRTGAALMPAMGYDYVPGTLAGALALERAGARAARVEIGYFAPGRRREAGLSRGTRLSAVAALLGDSFAFRDGTLRRARLADRTRRFDVDGRTVRVVSAGGVEHHALPAVFPGLREVEVGVGWFGPAAPAVAIASRALAALKSLPGGTAALRAVGGRLAGRPTNAGGPGGGESLALALARDASGRPLARVELRGPEPYAFTAAFMAWAAMRAARHGVARPGALGAVEAFGLRELERGCRDAGLREQPPGGSGRA